jgi:hypothetical protein
LTALVVTVAEAFIHCSKAAYRSSLWDPGNWPDTSGMPSISAVVKDHLAIAPAPTSPQRRMQRPPSRARVAPVK